MFNTDLCTICLKPIESGDHAVDRDGDRWDCHTGECAAKAGIQEAS